MRTIGSESGEGKAGCLFWVLLLVAGVVAGSKMIPPEIDKLKLRDHMQELALTQPNGTEQFFKKEIRNKARFLKMDIPKDQIQVKKYETRVIMEVEYIVPLDFYLFQWDWKRRVFVDEEIFLI